MSVPVSVLVSLCLCVSVWVCDCVGANCRYQRVVLLNELCARFSGDIALVDLFFNTHGSESPGGRKNPGDMHSERQFPVFAALTQYMHEPGDTGRLARDSLRLCVALSAMQLRIRVCILTPCTVPAILCNKYCTGLFSMALYTLDLHTKYT